MTDALALSQQLVPYVTAAMSAYGTAVLTRTVDLSADATVSLGQRILDRILRRSNSHPQDRDGINSALVDLAEDPNDPDLQAALRVQLRKLLRDEPDLMPELMNMASEQGVTITASGERSVAAHTIHGGVHTGDRHG